MLRDRIVVVEATRLTPEGVACRLLSAADALALPAGELLVPGLLPGERARVRLGAHSADARVLALLAAHPARRPPPCPRYREPAACPLLCLEPAAQPALKDAMLRLALEQAGLPPAPGELLPLLQPASTGYRAKAVFAVAADRAGLPRFGYYAPGSHRLRPGTACPLHRPELDRLAGRVEQACRDAGLAAFVEGSAGGGLRFVTLRVSRGGGAWVLLTGRAGTPGPALEQAAARMLAAAGEELRAVWWSEQEQSENAVVGERLRLLDGGDLLWERAGRVAVPLTAGAFHQVNPDAGDLLVRAVLEAAAAPGPGPRPGTRRALDLYCGAGAYALNLAAAGWEVTGVERAGEAVAAARQAAQQAELGVRWIEQDAAAFVRDALATGGPASPSRAASSAAGSWDLVVLNPPRRGVAATLLADLLALRPPALAYVSCHPATLARDLALLAAGGYRPWRVQPVDLLPQTAHLETVALLKRGA